MKSSSDAPRETAFEDPRQPLIPDPPDDRQRSVAEWTGDLLLGIMQPVQFRLADWP
ncbi:MULTISPECIES: hypothetical protein [unclassified Arthrobacter]|uniref:hypothetical protein n=1 Tax=unclassified Arthrobacter TaxID=235627 RepID=UPI001319DFE8|nr:MULTISPECIES: hypothetical protein [unclassified Arthrobacter]MDT0196005.1 hypothetical protein [Arthrobacter sp. AB6]